MSEERTTPTFAQLLDWVEGKLDADAAAQIQAQVDAALASEQATLHETLAWLRAFRARAQKTVLVSAPADVKAGVLRMFEGASAQNKHNVIQRMIAQLTRSIAPGLAMAGARSTTSSRARPRQLRFECAAADIVLSIARDADDRGFNLTGQVLPRPVTGVSVAQLAAQLLRDDVEVALTTTDAFGEFAFAELLPGHYALMLASPAIEIGVEPIELA